MPVDRCNRRLLLITASSHRMRAIRRSRVIHQDHAGGIMFATRGCPSKCEFCSIIAMYPGGLRRRPVEEVAREFGSFSGKVIIFWDRALRKDPELPLALEDELAVGLVAHVEAAFVLLDPLPWGVVRRVAGAGWPARRQAGLISPAP
jgi:hypothetical protein